MLLLKAKNVLNTKVPGDGIQACLPAGLEPLLRLVVYGRQPMLFRAVWFIMWKEYGLGRLSESFGDIEDGDNVTGQPQ